MQLRVVAIPLIAAICLGSPATASPIDDEQMVRGRGARDRSGDGGGGTASGGAAPRSGGGERRGGGDRPTVSRGGDTGRRGDNGRETARTTNRDNDGDRTGGQRVAVPRDGGDYSGRDRDRGRFRDPRVVTRDRRDINIINVGGSYRPRYYAPVYYDRWARDYYRWSPIRYVPWSLAFGSIGFSSYGFYGSFGSPYNYGHYGYPVYGGYSYPYRASGYDIGGVRLKIRPRDAQVFVDGYYAGLVDDFDGTFQSLRLDAGGHKIEIHMPGFEDLELDVHVQPGRTITLHEDLRPRP